MASAGISITVTANTDQLARAFKNLGEKQIPFIIAKSLTRLAQEGRDDVRGGLDVHFTVRNQGVKRGINIQRAEKRDWPDIFAVVGSKDDFMVQHETGDTKRARSGGHLAVPNVAEGGRGGAITRTSRGSIPASMKPKKVLGRRRAFINRIAHGGHRNYRHEPVLVMDRRTKPGQELTSKWKYVFKEGGRTYRSGGRGQGAGGLAILQRVGKSRYPLKLLYAFQDSAKIKKVDWFSPRVQKVVARRYPAIFEQVMDQAFGEEARRVTERQ